ncbi:hypothetical protein AB1Y20_017542 [Prymnesium parvum]|uniref:Uncharacterized protein n=1 Tax=Prymnesium parvum TaxID=97485 RepID=A0AB34JNP9_PRYPA
MGLVWCIQDLKVMEARSPGTEGKNACFFDGATPISISGVDYSVAEFCSQLKGGHSGAEELDWKRMCQY